MTTENKDKKPGRDPERRQRKRPRRRLVDLTRMAGTDRREKKGDRRTETAEKAAGNPGDEEKPEE